MSKRTYVSALLIAVLVMMGAFSAMAQEPTFGLSEEDFALWSQANAQSAAETRFGFDFSASLEGEIDGEPGSLSVSASGGLDTAAPAAQMTFDFTSAGGDSEPMNVNGELIVLDGNFYINVTDPATGEPTGWMGDSLESLSSSGMAVAGVPSTDALPDMTGALAESLTGALAEIDPSTFIAFTRDGNVFTINVSLADFAASGGGAALLDAVLGAAGEMQPGAIPPGMSADAIMPMVQPVFDGITISLAQTIDPDAMRVQRTELAIGIDLPAQSPPLMLPEPIALTFTAAVDLTSYGEALVIEVPEDVTMGAFSSAMTMPPVVEPTIMPLPTVEAPVITEPQPIEAGESVTVSFNSAPVSFTFDAAAGDIVTITASSVDGSLDTTLQLLDPSGLMIQFNDDHNSDEDLNRFDSLLGDIELRDAGTYTIVVNTLSGSGSGDITVTLTSGAGEAPEPTPTEQPPAPDEPVQGQPLTAGETNYVVFSGAPVSLTYEGTEGEIVTITVSSEDGSLDPTLTLLNPDGDEIGFNDDHNSDLDLNRFDSALIDVELDSDGVYTLVINTFSGSGDGMILVTLDSGASGDDEGGKDGGSSQGGEGSPIVVEGEVPDDETFEYTFEGVEGDIVTITARATDNSLDPVTTLLGPDGDEVASNDDHDDDDPDLERFDSRISEFELPETGEYTVSVRGFGGFGGELELTIEFGSGGSSGGGQQGQQGGSGNDREAGDTETVEGSINAGEAFSYELEVNEGDVFTITAHALADDFDPVLAIYDEDGQLVVRNDDHGTGARDLNAFDSRVERYIFRDAGTYTIEVTGYRESEGDFEVTIEFVTTGAPTDEGETTEYEGSIRANGSFDLDLDLEEGQFVTITVHAEGEEFDPIVALLSPDGELLAINDDHGSGDRSLNFFDSRITDFYIEDSDTYTVEVIGYNDTAGDFTVIVTIK